MGNPHKIAETLPAAGLQEKSSKFKAKGMVRRDYIHYLLSLLGPLGETINNCPILDNSLKTHDEQLYSQCQCRRIIMKLRGETINPATNSIC